MARNILIVDDDTDFRTELREYLSEFKITETANGEEALNLLRRPNEIDIVILDVMMPGRPGTHILKEIKKIAPGIKVIILTGYSSKDIAIESLKGRADDYIEKPLNIEKLHEIIDQLSSGAGQNGRDVMENITKFIEKNINKNVGLKDVAGSIGLSAKYLSRMFKERMKIGFNQYKQELRMKKAKSLLDNTKFTIAHVSDLLGYENVESFIRRFKSMTGKTPSRYRLRKGK